jgi:UDP-glucuronate decarboxylase
MGQFNRTRVLVTGGAGFLGSHLCERLVAQDQPITIYGDGTQTRSFCYVDDMVEAFMLLMNSGDEITGPINLGNPCEFTMLELAQAVLDITGSSSRIELRPLPHDDPRQRRPNIEKAREILGWNPQAQLKEGLSHTVKYFDRVLSANKQVALLTQQLAPQGVFDRA